MNCNEDDVSFNEAELNNLCSHYKDTYDIHTSSIKQRDILFYTLLILLPLFYLQITSESLVNGVIEGMLDEKFGIHIDEPSNVFNTMLWFLLFGFTSKYFQTVVQIERQYDYIHHLEQIINKVYSKTKAFTREGASYASEYPIFSRWLWALYTIAFPCIILICITVRIKFEVAGTEFININLIPSLLSYLLVVVSTTLYLGKIHGSSLLTKIKNIFASPPSQGK